MTIPEEIKEKFFHKRSADHEYTTVNIPRVVHEINTCIVSLKVTRDLLAELTQGKVNPHRQLTGVSIALQDIELQLANLQTIYELLDYTAGPEES